MADVRRALERKGFLKKSPRLQTSFYIRYDIFGIHPNMFKSYIPICVRSKLFIIKMNTIVLNLLFCIELFDKSTAPSSRNIDLCTSVG